MDNATTDMTEAMQRIETFCGSSVALALRDWLSKAQMWRNSAAFLHSVAVAADKDALLDHLATLRYSLIFRSLGLLPSFEPTGVSGPDLLITRDGISATVEVTRFRPVNPGPPTLSRDEYIRGEWHLEPYGNPQRDIQKCIRKVRDKFRQTVAPHAIIAVWNDDDALEELEMRSALRDLRQDPRIPKSLEFVVYGSSWIGHSQLYSFPMKSHLHASIQEWAQEIQSVSVGDAINSVLRMDEHFGTDG
jgi:hypothetical protein